MRGTGARGRAEPLSPGGAVLDGQWQGDEVVRSTEAPGRLVLRVLLWAGVLVVGPVPPETCAVRFSTEDRLTF